MLTVVMPQPEPERWTAGLACGTSGSVLCQERDVPRLVRKGSAYLASRGWARGGVASSSRRRETATED